MKLTDIAEEIQAHLALFAADPKVATTQNIYGPRSAIFLQPRAWSAGSRIGLRYVAGPIGHDAFLSKSLGEEYLAWLDNGNVGTHHDQQRAAAFAAMQEARGL